MKQEKKVFDLTKFDPNYMTLPQIYQALDRAWSRTESPEAQEKISDALALLDEACSHEKHFDRAYNIEMLRESAIIAAAEFRGDF